MVTSYKYVKGPGWQYSVRRPDGSLFGVYDDEAEARAEKRRLDQEGEPDATGD